MSSQARHERELAAHPRQSIALVLFPLTTGIVDVISYVGLHRVFTANMTGNSALLAIAVAEGSLGASARSCTALLAYCLGAAIGALTRVPTKEREWLARVAVPVSIEALVLLALTIGWLAAGASPRGWVVYPLISAAAVAMGIQSAANRPSGFKAVSTTYMTGIITRGVEAGVARWRPVVGERDEDAGLRARVWLVYLAGAAAGAFAALRLHGWSAGIATALIAAVATVCWQATSSPSRRGESAT